MSSSDVVRQAIDIARAGRKEEARDMLLEVVESDPHNELAWIWLSGLVDSLEDRIIACENVLTINPSNEKVRAYLIDLNRQQSALAIKKAKDQADGLFRQAQSFRESGDKENALRLIRNVLEQNNHHEGAWLLTADLSDDLNEKVHALKMALGINSSNLEIQTALNEALHFRANPLDFAARLEEDGKYKEAIDLYKQLAAKTKNSGEFDRIYNQIIHIEKLQEEKIEYINPSSSIWRLTFTWPLLYLILILVQMGLNPFAHPALYLCLGLPVVGLGSFLLALAEVRSRHVIWKKLFSETGAGGSLSARWIASIAGWLLVISPHILLLVDSYIRLRNFRIPPEPY